MRSASKLSWIVDGEIFPIFKRSTVDCRGSYEKYDPRRMQRIPLRLEFTLTGSH